MSMTLRNILKAALPMGLLAGTLLGAGQSATETPRPATETPGAAKQTPAKTAETPPPTTETPGAAKETPPAETPHAAAPIPAGETRRWIFGVRVTYFQTHFFPETPVRTSTTNPVADYDYHASSPSPRTAVGPTVEYRFSDHLSFGMEFRFHHVAYQQKTVILSGLQDPNQTWDSRKKTTITEDTKANYWEFPFLARYSGIWKEGWLKKRTYVLGGFEYRYVGKIRTGTQYSYADTTTDYNETPATPKTRHQLGAIMGVGVRFMDDFRIKLSPEVRYTRWFGTTFEGVAYRSAGNQLEGSFGISF